MASTPEKGIMMQNGLEKSEKEAGENPTEHNSTEMRVR